MRPPIDFFFFFNYSLPLRALLSQVRDGVERGKVGVGKWCDKIVAGPTSLGGLVTLAVAAWPNSIHERNQAAYEIAFGVLLIRTRRKVEKKKKRVLRIGSFVHRCAKHSSPLRRCRPWCPSAWVSGQLWNVHSIMSRPRWTELADMTDAQKSCFSHSRSSSAATPSSSAR